MAKNSSNSIFGSLWAFLKGLGRYVSWLIGLITSSDNAHVKSTAVGKQTNWIRSLFKKLFGSSSSEKDELEKQEEAAEEQSKQKSKGLEEEAFSFEASQKARNASIVPKIENILRQLVQTRISSPEVAPVIESFLKKSFDAKLVAEVKGRMKSELERLEAKAEAKSPEMDVAVLKAIHAKPHAGFREEVVSGRDRWTVLNLKSFRKGKGSGAAADSDEVGEQAANVVVEQDAALKEIERAVGLVYKTST